MEIQIDTGALSQNNNKFNITNIKSEEIINSEIENFVKISLNDKENKFKENYVIAIDYFLLEKTEERGMVVYGTIQENNQTFYEFHKKHKVFIYTKNNLIINKLISLFVKLETSKVFTMKFETEECFIIPAIDFENKNKIFIKMIFLSSIVKIFFSVFLKFKFNKYINILINSNKYEEAYLLSKILYLMGYGISINNTNFNFTKLKEDFNSNEDNFVDIIEINNDKNLLNFNFIIDTTGEMLSTNNKINTFASLKFDGKFILLDSKNLIHNKQLDPRDLEYITNKNLNLSFVNIENCLKFNKTIGREINFINDIIDKIINSEDVNNLKMILKKVDCKITDTKENLKEITMDEIVSNNNFINLYIL
jgi:hypothetical protein